MVDSLVRRAVVLRPNAKLRRVIITVGLPKEIGHMDAKPAQNIQDTFLNTVRKDKSPITIYLVSGVKLTGKIRSFDKYSVLLENNAQEQLIFKHAISTVVSGRVGPHTDSRSDVKPESRTQGGHGGSP